MMIKIHAEINSVFFLDQTKGYAASSNGLLKTLDKGGEWQYL
jgi:photosystem II stability/assembly factor-like uncharacterized protein